MRHLIICFIVVVLIFANTVDAFQASVGSALATRGRLSGSGSHFVKGSAGIRGLALRAKKCVSDLKESEIAGKRVFVRTDFNVPLKEGKVTDDTRIRGALPTLNYLKDRGAKVIIASHLGRPDGRANPKYSLSHVTPRLNELMGQTALQLDDCIGPKVAGAVSNMKNGDIVVLENVRYYQDEEQNAEGFSSRLAVNADIFVNDAFGTAHRAHSSTCGIAKYLKTSVAGLLMEKELQYLQGVVETPARPFVAIVGGSKVSTKISVIESLLNKVNKLVLGGGMVFTFLAARGLNVGSSLVEKDQLELARSLEIRAKEKGVELFLASDVVVADKFDANANHKIVDINSIPDNWMGLDIGPKSIASIKAGLADAKTVIWNGPMGVFEFDAFAAGTNAIAQTLAELTKTKGTITVVGGGDSVAAVEKAGLAKEMSHISTGGGASLELLEGKVLPGVAVLNDK